MVTQIKPVLCPKCKKSVLGIGRSWRGGSKLVTVEVHHHEDAKRYALGQPAAVCTFKATANEAGYGMQLCITGTQSKSTGLQR